MTTTSTTTSTSTTTTTTSTTTTTTMDQAFIVEDIRKPISIELEKIHPSAMMVEKVKN